MVIYRRLDEHIAASRLEKLNSGEEVKARPMMHATIASWGSILPINFFSSGFEDKL